MHDTTHTPGPWHENILPASKYVTVYAGRNTHICNVVPILRNEMQTAANRRLIAAAPDLLEAAQVFVRYVQQQELIDPELFSTSGGRLLAEPYNNARAAIAKAIGDSR